MKTTMYIFLFFYFFIISHKSNAQIEISPLLDTTPSNGISNYISSAQAQQQTFLYTDALEACRSLDYDGKTDWYLPTWEEFVLFLPSPPAPSTPGSNPTTNTTSTMRFYNCTNNANGLIKGGGSGIDGCNAELIPYNVNNPIALRMSNTHNYGMYALGLVWRWYYNSIPGTGVAPLRYYNRTQRFTVYCVR